MQTINLTYLIIIVISFLITGGLATFSWLQKWSFSGRRTFALMVTMESLLSISEILFVLARTESDARFWYDLRYLFLSLISVLWVIFVVCYREKKEKFSKTFIAALFFIPLSIIPIISVAPLQQFWYQQQVTMQQIGPFWTTDFTAQVPGIWFLIVTCFDLVMVTLGTVLFLKINWKKKPTEKGQTWLITIGVLIAFLAFGTSTLNLIPIHGINPLVLGLGLNNLFLIFAILRFRFLNPPAVENSSPKTLLKDPNEKRLLIPLIFIFLVLSIIINTLGFLTFQKFQIDYTKQVKGQLSSIATLIKAELLDWRQERLSDIEILYQNITFISLVNKYFENPLDASSRLGLQDWLKSFSAYHQYESISLLDAHGVERINVRLMDSPVHQTIPFDPVPIFRDGKPIFLDFFRVNPEDPIHLSIIAPIYRLEDHAPLGLLVFLIDPNVYLYPFIQEWPIPSNSAETLLVKRVEDRVVFLNKLRFYPDAALTLSYPLTETEILSVKAALGQTGIFEGYDYRGVNVIADIRSIPDSPWFLISKIDLTEVNTTLQNQGLQTLSIMGFLTLIVGFVLFQVWRRYRLLNLENQLQILESIKVSEDKFKMLFTFSPSASALISLKKGKIHTINEGFNRILGFSMEEVAGRTTYDLKLWVTNEERDRFTSELQTKSFLDNFETRLRSKNGEIHDCSVSASLINLEGELFIFSSIWDISDRKKMEQELLQSEMKFRSMFQNNHSVMMIVDPENGEIVDANPAAAIYYGWDIEILKQKKISEINTLSETETSYEMGRALAEHRNFFEFRHLLASGEIRNVEVYSGPIEQEGKTVLYSIIQDVTLRNQQALQLYETSNKLQKLLSEASKSRQVLISIVEDQKIAQDEVHRLNNELEERVARRTAQLESSNKELEAFAYSVSHDLRAPLRAIDGYSTILMQEYAQKLNQEGIRLLDIIRASTAKMDQLITDLLALSRVGRTELKFTLINMTSLVNSVYNEMASTEVKEKFLFQVNDLPDIWGDLTLMRQVWTNLIANSIKYTMPQNRCVIEISGAKNNGLFTFRIKDNGVGFNPKYMDKLFGLFQRLHKTGEFEGTGVGLAIVQRIITRHGGRIWAESQLNEGAVFQFEIPERVDSYAGY
ncbi:MAG: PAS domain S-box protein [Chloroflexi bacterium]|nr:PAS domain S-box protein [Chloroflexota bacterium]